MSSRKGIYASTSEPCDGGVSPNAFVPAITAEIRLFFPPNTVSREEVEAAFTKVRVDVERQITEFFDYRREKIGR